MPCSIKSQVFQDEAHVYLYKSMGKDIVATVALLVRAYNNLYAKLVFHQQDKRVLGILGFI